MYKGPVLSFKQLLLILIILFVTLLIGSAVFADWQGPTAAPPGNNVDAPVNVGITLQNKNGALGVGGLAVFGETLLGGDVGTNAYLNFGKYIGQGGYGFRDNSGAMQYSDNGGTWTSFSSLASGGGSGSQPKMVSNSCPSGTDPRTYLPNVGSYNMTICSVACPASTKVLGGGCTIVNGSGTLQDSVPVSGYDGSPYNGWTCVYNGTGYTAAAAYATCQ